MTDEADRRKADPKVWFALVMAAAALVIAVTVSVTALSSNRILYQIQKERVRNTRVQCQTDRQHNKDTKAIAARAFTDPKARRFVYSLIDGLAPDHKSCDQQVKKKVPSAN